MWEIFTDFSPDGNTLLKMSFVLKGQCAMQIEAVGERVLKPLRLRLKLKVKVLWVEVVNPDVSVLSSAAVTASTTNSGRKHVSKGDFCEKQN